MTVKRLAHPLPRGTLEELARFERQFQYPLGPNDHFSISHEPLYMPFFTAMGPATLLVAEHCGSIVGTMVIVRRLLRISIPGCRDARPGHQEANYLCDLKVHPDARSGPTPLRLLSAAAEAVRLHQSQSCYCTIMSGTRTSPAMYTGWPGVPKFAPICEVAVLRFLTGGRRAPDAAIVIATEEEFAGCEEKLFSSGVRPDAGESSLRSEMPVMRLCHDDGTACGSLEDTRRGKRLLAATGEEIVSAHLSRFAWSEPAAAAELLRGAIAKSYELGYPAVFCSLPLAAWARLKPLVGDIEYLETSATVYGHQIPPGLDWWIDTSEI